MSERKRARNQAGSMTWETIAKLFGFEVSPESLKNISKINSHLRDSAVVVFLNHQKMRDTPFTIAFLLAHLPHAGDMMGPAGMKHFDFRRDPVSAAVFRMLPPIGIRPVPVVQDGDGHNYLEKAQKSMIERLKLETRVAIVSPGGVYGIAPEGTRSNSGKLQTAKRGLGYLPGFDEDERLMYAPVGLIYKDETLKNENNEIRVGEPFRFSQLGLDASQLPEDRRQRAQLIADTMMSRLAAILPESMRGVYGEKAAQPNS